MFLILVNVGLVVALNIRNTIRVIYRLMTQIIFSGQIGGIADEIFLLVMVQQVQWNDGNCDAQ